METFTRCTSVALIVVMLSACTSMQTLADGPANAAVLMAKTTGGLQEGMTLMVVLKNGQKQTLVLAKAEPTALVGSSNGQAVRIEADQISRIEQREVNGAKTAGLVVGIGLGVALLVAAMQGVAAGQIMDQGSK